MSGNVPNVTQKLLVDNFNTIKNAVEVYSPSALLPGDGEHMIRKVVAKFQSLKNCTDAGHETFNILDHH